MFLYKANVINHLLRMTKTQIPYLPPEMIENILKRSYSSTLQNCLEIKYLAEFAQKELDKRYQRCLKVLIELGINEVGAKKQLAKGIINLNPVRAKVTDTSVTALANNCSGLTEIWLAYCSKITDTSVTALAEHCSGLTKILLFRCSNITDYSVTALANNCSGLTMIDLSGCSKITVTTKQLLRDKCVVVY